jgi:hypothetical protein
LFHALVLKNFGASHLVVADAQRDLAGAEVFLRARMELGVRLLRGSEAVGGAAPPAAHATAA